MKCADLTDQAARRLDESGSGEEFPIEVRRHLDDCSSCRAALIEADPSAIFLGARRLEVEPTDLEEIAVSTRSWLRMSRMDVPAAPRSRIRPLRWAAGLAACAVLGWFAAGGRTEPTGGEPVGSPWLEPMAAHSRIENLNRPGARVYQWGSKDLDVVMVVDESLDL